MTSSRTAHENSPNTSEEPVPAITRKRGGLLLGLAAVAVVAVAGAGWFVAAGSDDGTSLGTPTGVSVEAVDVSLETDDIVAISEDGRAVAGFDEDGLLCREWIDRTESASVDLACTEIDGDLTLRSTQIFWPTGELPMMFDNGFLFREFYVVDFEDEAATALAHIDNSYPVRTYQPETGARAFWDQELVETGPEGDVVNRYPDVATPPLSVTWLANGTILADQSGGNEMIQIRDGQSTVVHTEAESTLLLDASSTGDAALALDRFAANLLKSSPVSIVSFDTGSATTLPLPDDQLVVDAWFSHDETLVFEIWIMPIDGGFEGSLTVIELDEDLTATSDWITLHEWQDDGPTARFGGVMGRSDTEAVYLNSDGLNRIVFTYD